MIPERVSDAPTRASSLTPAGVAPGRWQRRLLALGAGVALLGGVTLGLVQSRLPAPPAGEAPAGSFSLARAMRDVARLSARPHPNASAAAHDVRTYIGGELERAGLTPVEQEVAQLVRTGAGRVVWRSVRNVLARLDGTRSRRALLVMAHYDSAAASPGANDNGAGVATVLETARALRGGTPPASDVIFLFTDAEELGLSGAGAFATQHAWAQDVGVVLNFDARGSSGPSLMFETSAGNGWLIREYARGTPWPRASSLYGDIYRLMGNDTDLSVILRRPGIGGLNFAFVESPGRHHTAGDTLATLQPATLHQQGANAVSLVRHLAAGDATPRVEPDAVYFTIGGTLIVYSARWRWVLAGMLLLGLAGVVWRAMRRDRRDVWPIVRTMFGALLAVPAAAVAAWGVRRMLPMVAPALDTPGLGLYANAFQQAGVALVALAVVLALLDRLRRRTTRMTLVLGSLMAATLAATLLSIALPGASYVLAWPALGSLALVAGLWRYGDQRFWPRPPQGPDPCRAWDALACGLLCGLFAGLLVAPVVSVLFTALGLDAAPIAAVVVSLASLIALPLLLIATRRLGRAAAAAAVAALLLLGVGARVTRTSVVWPRHDNVFYAHSLDDGVAVWGTRDRPDPWTMQFVGTSPARGMPLPCLEGTGQAFHAPAPAVPVAEPAIRVVRDDRAGATRTIELQVQSTPGAWWMLRPAAADAEPVFLTQVNGAPVDRREPFRLLTARGAPPAAFAIRLETASAAPLAFTLVDSVDGLPASSASARPADVVRGDEGRLFNDTTVTCQTFSIGATAGGSR